MADMDVGMAAAERGDYAAAVEQFRPLADDGNVDAQYNLGLMYSHGLGVTQDHGEAARWYRLSADQGNVDAQINLGSLYDDGKGVPQDDGAARDDLS